MNSNFLKELGKIVLISVLIVVPFRMFVAQPFVVEGASMDPTFETGDYLIVDEFTYHFKQPERGSVLIFKYPENPKQSFIKRVIGLPNETITSINGKISITNAEYPDSFVLEEPYVKWSREDNFNLVLKANEYFVLGDNRLNSADSRIWGPVPEDNIIGRPIIRVHPPALLPGDNQTNRDTKTKNTK